MPRHQHTLGMFASERLALPFGRRRLSIDATSCVRRLDTRAVFKFVPGCVRGRPQLVVPYSAFFGRIVIPSAGNRGWPRCTVSDKVSCRLKAHEARLSGVRMPGRLVRPSLHDDPSLSLAARSAPKIQCHARSDRHGRSLRPCRSHRIRRRLPRQRTGSDVRSCVSGGGSTRLSRWIRRGVGDPTRSRSVVHRMRTR